MKCNECGYEMHTFNENNEPDYPCLWGSSVCDNCGHTSERDYPPPDIEE